ncbi:MAG: hypothetical protein HY817_01455 [Candidatus Abawacabacteria bacterium]|nr:hypothetical protein [Candidatus Abawacabacteria bacterium]
MIQPKANPDRIRELSNKITELLIKEDAEWKDAVGALSFVLYKSFPEHTVARNFLLDLFDSKTF